MWQTVHLPWLLYYMFNHFLPRYCYSHSEIGLSCLTSGSKGYSNVTEMREAHHKVDKSTCIKTLRWPLDMKDARDGYDMSPDCH